MNATRFGEVIEATTATFIAQCHKLGEPPDLGALVTSNDGTTQIYGVVHNASTGSIDPGRRFLALGQEEETEEGIFRSHPELDQLLRTDFQVIVVGHSSDGLVHQHLPPRPTRIHSFVYPTTQQQTREFTAQLGFLSILANSPIPSRDETLAACLRLVSFAQDDPGTFLVQACKKLAVLLAQDYYRLNTLLRMVRS